METRVRHGSGKLHKATAWRAILFVAAGLLLASCYGTRDEIIAPEQATPRVGLPGRYLGIAGGRANPKEWVRVEATPGSHDYRFEMAKDQGEPLKILRLLPLNETVWLAQIAEEGKSDRVLIFLRFVGDGVYFLGPDATDDTLRTLADAHGVTGQGIMGGFFMRGGMLVGDPADILALMRALAEGPMKMMSADYYEKR